jgi:hypothetical protein
MPYERSFRPTFTSRSEAELARILAPVCCECGDQYPVAVEPAEWSLLSMRSIEMLEPGVRDSLIHFRKLDPSAKNYLCGDCAYQLSGD